MNMHSMLYVSAERNNSNQAPGSDDEDDEASLQLLNLEDDDDDMISLATFDSSKHQHQSFSNSLGSILSSSRHSLGTTIGSIKKGLQSITKKAPKVGNKQENYCELHDMPSEVFGFIAGSSVADDLNPDSGHTGGSASDFTNENSFAGDEEYNDDEFELQLGSPKRGQKVMKHSPSPLTRKKATSPSTSSPRMRPVHRKKKTGSSASRSLPRNRKIRSANNNAQCVSHQGQHQGERNQSSHSAHCSTRKHRHVDTKRVLEKCAHAATSARIVSCKKSPNTVHSQLLNTAPMSPTIQGLHHISLNDHIDRRVSPRKPVTQSPRRERVHFDFDPKDVKSMIMKKKQLFHEQAR